MRSSLPEDYIDKINRLKAITPQPIVTGFGISNKEMALEALKHADGFVVGSTFVKAISEGATPSELTKLAKKIDPR
jgi:tryptophan synthase alpha chain